RVLLVDCCHRDPQAAKSFGAQNEAGLAEVLSGEVDLMMALQDTEFENLKVIGPGADVSELKGKMAAREMMHFLETAEKHFDHIIIDTPPALLMSDAKLLAPIVDAVIVAVGSRSSSLGMVRRCLSELQRDSANIIGLVLSGVRHTRGGYFAKNLSLFYGYENGNGAANGHAKSHRNGAADLPEMKILHEEDEDTSAMLLLADADKPHPRNKH
ncbi:MAG: CpsD/CapB family tyrosine-protein kinase, partial [Candidatus Hydrogenedentales bacterium]